MRPGQQKQRSRGRGNGSANSGGSNGNSNNNNQNRKGQNPLTRTYDSSGPDVKIRGTAQHIAEKYGTLARDAQSSGDRVMAENYLQHAEHYNRIIAAAQAMFQERFPRDERSEFSDRENGIDNDDNSGQDMEEGMTPIHQAQSHPSSGHQGSSHQQNAHQPQHSPQHPVPQRVIEPIIDGSGPQPVIEGTPAEVAIVETSSSPQGRVDRSSPASRRRSAGRPRRPIHREPGAEGEAGEPNPSVTETVE